MDWKEKTEDEKEEEQVWREIGWEIRQHRRKTREVMVTNGERPAETKNFGLFSSLLTAFATVVSSKRKGSNSR
jgi:hypothetical protein